MQTAQAGSWPSRMWLRLSSGDEARAGDADGDLAALCQRDPLVVAGVEHQRRAAHLAEEVAHVDVAEGVLEAHGVLGRRGLALELVEPGELLRGRRRA